MTIATETITANADAQAAREARRQRWFSRITKVEGYLSVLGLGVTPPHPEWGAMLSQGRDVIRYYPLAAIAPGVAITLVVLSFSIVCDGLRDALDPRLDIN